jgi:hypothetical protein
MAGLVPAIHVLRRSFLARSGESVQPAAAVRSSRTARRQADGATPIIFLNARLKAASDS